ncbi:hypothetical protein HMPREF1861_01138 [Corynebacterium kroppenstedtii]|nr:hypothetical protein HMPREF1861_01138 [Corynebacterium kroppenstedtii]
MAGSLEVVFAGPSQRLTPLPVQKRLIKTHLSKFENAHDFDEFLACFLVG